MDTDNGYRGKVQFAIIIRDSTIADKSKVESFESDNDANGSALTPQTAAVFSNITSIGPRAALNNVGSANYLAGAQIRRNSSISIFNSVIMGWPVGIFVDASTGVPVDNNIPSKLFVQNTVIAGSAKAVDYKVSTTAPTGWDAAAALNWFNTAAYGNSILATNDLVKLAAPFNYANPDVTPQAGSPVLTGAAFTHAKLSSGFTQVPFRGAVGTPGSEDGDWWKTWTSFK